MKSFISSNPGSKLSQSIMSRWLGHTLKRPNAEAAVSHEYMLRYNFIQSENGVVISSTLLQQNTVVGEPALYEVSSPLHNKGSAKKDVEEGQ